MTLFYFTCFTICKAELVSIITGNSNDVCIVIKYMTINWKLELLPVFAVQGELLESTFFSPSSNIIIVLLMQYTLRST